MALFETADGMTRWMEVDPAKTRFGDTMRVYLMTPTKPYIRASDEVPLPSVLPLQHRDYELLELRQNNEGFQYFYFREKL